MSGRSRLMAGGERKRGRPSTAASAHSTPQPQRQSRAPAQLPEYEPPSCPMNATARKALAELANNHNDPRKYDEHLKESVKLLTHTVRDINDRHAKRKDTLKNLQQKRRSAGSEEKSERERAEEAALLVLRTDVPELTTECEAGVRHVIDLQVEFEDGRNLLRKLVPRVEAESANAERAIQAQDEEDEDLVHPMPDVVGPKRILERERELKADYYASMPMYERYGLHNDYIGFKSMWHDAVHGQDGKPLPDASKWFSRHGAAAEDEDEGDSELVVAGEHISIRCPLSMAVMDEPYTSRTCKHTFNKPAIFEFLQSKQGRKWQCPQTGCNKVVQWSDFYKDDIMLRKIQRAQAREAQQDTDDEDEERDIDGDVSMQMSQPRSIKKERAQARGQQLIDNITGGAGAGAGSDEEEEDEV
ncbi:zinc-finger of the MIZ type in Nse subunit-domain-containing protein [Xylariomycetidae sp. FL0641]|nr:zinc-finger of the MIZ type in Nse subunit-domain-containing protein [Xylariomycetidae sp. FL0641]